MARNSIVKLLSTPLLILALIGCGDSDPGNVSGQDETPMHVDAETVEKLKWISSSHYVLEYETVTVKVRVKEASAGPKNPSSECIIENLHIKIGKDDASIRPVCFKTADEYDFTASARGDIAFGVPSNDTQLDNMTLDIEIKSPQLKISTSSALQSNEAQTTHLESEHIKLIIPTKLAEHDKEDLRESMAQLNEFYTMIFEMKGSAPWTQNSETKLVIKQNADQRVKYENPLLYSQDHFLVKTPDRITQAHLHWRHILFSMIQTFEPREDTGYKDLLAYKGWILLYAMDIYESIAADLNVSVDTIMTNGFNILPEKKCSILQAEYARSAQTNIGINPDLTYCFLQALKLQTTDKFELYTVFFKTYQKRSDKEKENYTWQDFYDDIVSKRLQKTKELLHHTFTGWKIQVNK
jgi:hypothetical protein